MNKLILNNIEIHNKIANKYHNIHPEIFNDIEQKRLNSELKLAINNILTNTKIEERKAIDYGCGSGNLTAHLLDFNLNVISSDVSKGFLNLIEKQFGDNPKSSRFLLNGSDIIEFENDTIDFIGLFSVLHHIPDYLKALNDIARIVKPGGVIFIDHEASPGLWENKDKITEFYNLYKEKSLSKKTINLFNYKWYYRRFKKLLNPRWQAEGDIHVWDDDHIEWDKIESILINSNFDLLYYKDYLHFNKNYNLSDYQSKAKSFNDCRTAVFRKKS